MERRGERGTVSSESNDSRSSRFSPHQPSYSSNGPDFSKSIVQDALEHLASIDLIKLCNEAKVECCRATRDLRSCGRFVQHVLNSCGHASLCAECSQRCDVCPICRVPVPKNDCRLRLRLYNECMEAGLISKRHDDRFLEKEDEKQLMSDIQRLYSLFDVALENNLVSLVCHYVTDVCLDESAVSNDPVVAFLLDEVVVKDWCKRKFGNIITELREIYNPVVAEMEMKSELLLKFVMQLTGISNVLEVLESSFKGTVCPQLLDLHHLSDNVLKAKQHLEVTAWCVRHHFLQNIPLRYCSIFSWRSIVHDRKSAAVKRSWPDFASKSMDSDAQPGPTLFIEDALSNLGIEQGYGKGMGEKLELTCLQNDGGSPLLFKSKIEGMAGCYPFENLQNAIDLLFLRGSSDLVVAKQAIFLYYLFDRHWSIPNVEWRHLIDDFAGTFGIARCSVLESLIFYLLDDHTELALQEACRLLPEIAGPTLHPKIAQVLLERENPEAALMVLRCSGHDGMCAYTNSQHNGMQLVSLGEAVTAVRVRIECGLLTEAYMYQSTHCLTVKEEELRHGNNSKRGHNRWLNQMEVLVTEICCLCIRRNIVDRMIELPWNSEEEKYLHRCLFDSAQDLSTTSGSFLVVFYLQRCRYIEAYQVDCKLRSLEQNFISKFTDEELVSRIKSTSQWRVGLVDKCIELLPEVQRLQLIAGNIPDLFLLPAKEAEPPSNHDFSAIQQPNATSLPTASSITSSIVLSMDLSPLLSKKATTFDTQTRLNELVSNPQLELSTYRAPSILHGRSLTFVRDPSLLQGTEPPTPNRLSSYPRYRDSPDSNQLSGRKQSGQGFPVDDIPRNYLLGSHFIPLKELNKGLSRTPHNLSENPQFHREKIPLEMERKGSVINHVENSHPSSVHGILAGDYDPTSTPNNYGKNMAVPGKRILPDRTWVPISSDRVDFSRSKIDSVDEDPITSRGPRWRSDETSEDEGEAPRSIRKARGGRRRSRLYG